MKELKIGRNDDNDIVIKNQSVSRYHAIIHITDSYIVFEDLESSNGSFINGNRILRPIEITERDIIKVGTELIPWKNHLSNSSKKSALIEKKVKDLNQEEITEDDTITEINEEISLGLISSKSKKTFSIIGFVISILGLLSFSFFILGILGIMFSLIGLLKEKNGLAKAGLVIAIISILLGITITALQIR